MLIYAGYNLLINRRSCGLKDGYAITSIDARLRRPFHSLPAKAHWPLQFASSVWLAERKRRQR